MPVRKMCRKWYTHYHSCWKEQYNFLPQRKAIPGRRSLLLHKCSAKNNHSSTRGPGVAPLTFWRLAVDGWFVEVSVSAHGSLIIARLLLLIFIAASRRLVLV